MRANGMGAAVLALAAGGCAIVGPLYDRQMRDAPRAACAAANGSGDQCFVLLEEGPGGVRRAWSGGALGPGRALVAIHQPGREGCGGRFTHLTVSGASDGAGRAELSIWDPLGRPGHQRAVRWDRGFASRDFALASIDNVTMLPAGARLRMLEGGFTPANLCFKSY